MRRDCCQVYGNIKEGGRLAADDFKTIELDRKIGNSQKVTCSILAEKIVELGNAALIFSDASTNSDLDAFGT